MEKLPEGDQTNLQQAIDHLAQSKEIKGKLPAEDRDAFGNRVLSMLQRLPGDTA